MSRVVRHLQAFGLPWDAVDELADNDDSALGSSYSEAGPRPGAAAPQDPLSRLVPVISGAQSADLELVTIGTGSPGVTLEGGAEVGYRFAGELDAQVRGWAAPNWLTWWSAAVWSDATTYTARLVCTHTPTQRVVVSYATGALRWTRVWDPRTCTWETEIPVSSTASLGVDDDVLLCLPSGRLLCKQGLEVWRSDDAAQTWVLHREQFDLTGAMAGDRARAGVAGTSIAWISSNSAGPTLSQFASDDDLASLTEVGSPINGKLADVVGTPTGGFVVAYRRNTDDALCVRVLGTAWSPLGDAEVVEVDANAGTELALSCDPDGLLWLVWSRNASRSQLRVACSLDGGHTWTTLDDSLCVLSAAHGDYLTDLALASSCGALYLCHGWVATTGNEDGSVGLATLGGWSTVVPADVPWTGRLGSGPTTSGLTWLPIELPGDTGQWTATGAGPDSLTAGLMHVGSGAAVQRYWEVATGTDLYAVVHWGVRIGSAGSLSTDDVAVNVRLANGLESYVITVRMGPTGVRVYDDVAGSALATVTETWTGEDREFLLRLREPGGTTYNYDSVWWKRPHETDWELIWEGGLLANTATPAAAGRVRWGHIASSTAESDWTFFVQQSPSSAVHSYMVGGGLDTVRHVRGRPIGALPVPLHPETGPEAAAFEIGGGPAWLSLVAGPAALSEVYDVPAEYDYAAEHLFCTESPSPAEPWRSDDTAEQVFAWDHVNPTFHGDALFVVAREANFRTAYLEVYAGGSWSTAGTLDLATGFTGLSYDLSGTVLTPTTGTVAGARFVQEGEWAGATVLLEAGTKARRILWNTPGVWGPVSAGSQRVRVLLDPDTLDGTEAATGTCTIVHHSGVLCLVEATTLTAARRWRLRIPASQVTVDPWYEAGQLEPVEGRGITGCDWGWSRERAPNVTATTSRYGTTRVRRQGPAPRAVTIGWASSGTQQRAIRSGTPDYLSTGVATLPLATDEDVPTLLEGLVERLRGGELPCLWVPSVPSSSQTLTDPTAWLLGRWEGTVRSDHVAGTELVDELLRPASITLRELV